jgi:hypothetical protein
VRNALVFVAKSKEKNILGQIFPCFLPKERLKTPKTA